MKTHWKKLVNPDYLGAYDFQPGEERVLTIANVTSETVTNSDGKGEDCIVCRFTTGKPMILNRTNAKTIAKLYGTPYIEEWAGKSIQLYVTRVRAFGDMVEALRIRPTEPKVEKEKITPERFAKMLEAIKSGQFSASDACERFALTPDQLKQLPK